MSSEPRLTAVGRGDNGGLSIAQANYLDGIRISCQIAKDAFDRLTQHLVTIGDVLLKGQKGAYSPSSEAFGSAWQIVDCAHRVVKLLANMPGLKKNASPTVALFKERVGDVTAFRNIIQHLESDGLHKLAKTDRAFGTLEWLWQPNSPGPIHSFKQVSGWAGSGEYGICYQLDTAPEETVDRVLLKCRTKELDLRKVARAMVLLGASVSELVAGFPGGKPSAYSPVFYVEAQVREP